MVRVLTGVLPSVDKMDELSQMKKMTRSTLGFFYPEAELSDSEMPRLLDSLPGRVRGYVKTH